MPGKDTSVYIRAMYAMHPRRHFVFGLTQSEISAALQLFFSEAAPDAREEVVLSYLSSLADNQLLAILSKCLSSRDASITG